MNDRDCLIVLHQIANRKLNRPIKIHLRTRPNRQWTRRKFPPYITTPIPHPDLSSSRVQRIPSIRRKKTRETRRKIQSFPRFSSRFRGERSHGRVRQQRRPDRHQQPAHRGKIWFSVLGFSLVVVLQTTAGWQKAPALAQRVCTQGVASLRSISLKNTRNRAGFRVVRAAGA